MAADLAIIFGKAVDGNKNKQVAAQLTAMEEAARRGAKPSNDLNRITGFIESEDEAVATAAIRLIGLWQIKELNGTLVNLAEKGKKNSRKAALDALVSMKMTKRSKPSLSFRVVKTQLICELRRFTIGFDRCL